MIFALASCKKQYDCSCGTTIKYSSGQDYYTSKTAPMDKKMTKKQAEGVCENEAYNINATYMNLLTNNGTTSSGGVSATTNCNIK